MKTDLLFIAAHPDDVELCCGGTVLRHIAMGYTVGVVDLTAGELGTRGTAETRAQEAAKASQILGLSFRDNLGLPDGFFDLSEASKRKIICAIRQYQPDIVITNAVQDRHPDHGRASQLVSESCFLSGLRKIETTDMHGNPQAAWRPRHVYHMIQDFFIKPDICVDITPYVDKKFEAIMAFSTQFFNPDSKDPVTPISGSDFFEFLMGRCREMGRTIGVEFAEGYTVERPVRVQDFMTL
jgi:bacillithiol biosynthesis deacetylase BshB1